MLKKIKLIFKFHTIGLINASIYNIKFNLTHHSQVIIIYNLIIHNLQVYERISQSYLVLLKSMVTMPSHSKALNKTLCSERECTTRG